MKFDENEDYHDFLSNKNQTVPYDGMLVSSYAEATGFSVTLPFMTISTEARVTFPFTYTLPSEDIPDTNQANYFKVGGGAGLEIPVVTTPLIVRFGYSYDELDLHQYAIKYSGDIYLWDENGIKVDKNRQLISAGIGLVTQNITFDLSYGYQTWGIIKHQILHQDYAQHQVSASFALRY